MATELAPIKVTDDQISLIRNTVAQGATENDLKLFFYDCQRRGVHPLDKLIHFTKRNGKYTPITSIDFMRGRAAETGEYAGNDDAAFGETFEEKFPHSATVTVYRIVQGQRCPFTATARWAEYVPNDNQAFMWKKMPYTMLGKCAEALALRKAFPQQLSGLYSSEEMDQAKSAQHEESKPQETKIPDKSVSAAGWIPAGKMDEAYIHISSIENAETTKGVKYLLIKYGFGTSDKLVCYDTKLMDQIATDEIAAHDQIHVKYAVTAKGYKKLLGILGHIPHEVLQENNHATV